MFTEITSLHEYEELLAEKAAVLAYFSTNECSVCSVLKPKVAELTKLYFPNITLIYINSNNTPEIAAQNRIFVAPTILVYFEGHEYFRKSRSFGLDELKNELQRPYNLLFS